MAAHNKETRRHSKSKRPSIIYDPFREILTESVITEEQQANYERVEVLGTGNPVSIYVNVVDGPFETKSLLARVDLGQLGWIQWVQRHLRKGNTQEIFVKGRVPPTNGKVLSWPPTGKSGYGLALPNLPPKAESARI